MALRTVDVTDVGFARNGNQQGTYFGTLSRHDLFSNEEYEDDEVKIVPCLFRNGLSKTVNMERLI